MTQERTGVITFKGNPLTLLGNAVTVGQKAPEVNALANDLSPVTLANSQGKTRLLVFVPSLDTPVCDMEARRFNQEAAKLENVETLIVSMDLPFAQSRWCGAVEASNVKTVSDHREAATSLAYGVLIKELKLSARAIFVVDANDVVTYSEIVSEVTQEPNYEAALKAASQQPVGAA